MASFVENTQHKVERKAFEIMTNSIVGKLTKTDDIAKDRKHSLNLLIRQRLSGEMAQTRQHWIRSESM